MRLAFKDVLLIGGRSGPVENVSQMISLQKARDNFLREYRQSAKSVSVKVHITYNSLLLTF